MGKSEDNIFFIENFFSDDECNQLIAKSEQMGYEDAKINLHGKQVMMKTVRNNLRVLFKDEVYAEQIWNRIKQYVPKQIGKSVAFGLNELFRFYKYEEGHRFKMHRDGSYSRNETEFSQYSFLIYLNDDFEGGETVFRLGPRIQPKKGSALLFLHGLRHEGATLTKGTKYVLRTDIMYKLDEQLES